MILGAGPAGIGAAWGLRKTGMKIILVEKNPQVGGLCRTLRHGEFKTDIGPHRFYSHKKELYRLISNLLGPEWLEVARLTHFYVEGKLFLYPIQLRNALRTIGAKDGIKIIWDYLFERIRSSASSNRPVNVEEEVVSRFGRKLSELNILNYTEKVWGCHPSELSPDWTSQRIKDLDLFSVMTDLLNLSEEEPKTLINSFHYPAYGAGLLYEKMKDGVASVAHLNLLTSSEPTEIRHDGGKITGITIDTGDQRRSFSPRNVISSIPITEMIQLLTPGAPSHIRRAADQMKYRSHVGLFIKLDRESVMSDQWIYFPEKKIPFGRVSEPKNFSSRMSPDGKTSLLVEFFCWEGDEIWRSNAEEIFEISKKWLIEAGFLEESEVLNTSAHRERFAYPVYELGYEEHLDRVKDFLHGIENLQMIGRSGLFRYNNQDHSLEMGILAADMLKGRDHARDITKIGTTPEYLESGTHE